MNLKHLQSKTIDLITNHLSTDTYTTSMELAKKMGTTSGATEQRLRRLYNRGIVERSLSTCKRWGGRFYLYRKVPDGYGSADCAPLYDAQAGWDTRALAEAFGGYTYRRQLT
jgi:predicted transcriptional regulator